MKSEVIIIYLESEVIRTGSHKQNYRALTPNEVITPNVVITTNAVITPLTTINQNYHALTTLTTNEVITTLTTKK